MALINSPIFKFFFFLRAGNVSLITSPSLPLSPWVDGVDGGGVPQLIDDELLVVQGVWYGADKSTGRTHRQKTKNDAIVIHVDRYKVSYMPCTKYMDRVSPPPPWYLS